MSSESDSTSDVPASQATPLTFQSNGITYGEDDLYQFVLEAVRHGGETASKWRDAFGVGRIWPFLRDNAAWSVTVVTAAIISLKVFFAAHGDLNVAIAIVSTSGTATVLFGIAIQAISSVLTGSPFLWVFYAMNVWIRRLRERWLAAYCPDGPIAVPPLWVPRTTWSLILLVGFLAISFFFSIWVFFVIAAALIIFILTMSFFDARSWKRNARILFQGEVSDDERIKALNALSARPMSYENLVVILVVGLVVLLFTSSMWLPAQRFVTKAQGTFIGYQLSDADNQRTILIDSSRLPVVITDHDLISTTYCEIDPPSNTPSLFTELTGDSTTQLPTCHPKRPKGHKSLSVHRSD